MLISKAIKEYCSFGPQATGFFVQTDQYGYWNIIVEFTSPLKLIEYECVQFDILPAHFDYTIGKCPKLETLWGSYCKERKIRLNSVHRIRILTGWKGLF